MDSINGQVQQRISDEQAEGRMTPRKCNIVAEAVPLDPTRAFGGVMVTKIFCRTHHLTVEGAVSDKCLLGHIEELEARIEALERVSARPSVA